jgi:hypothetical protein
MRPVCHSILSTCVLTICWPATVQCEPASFWNHNGSVMALYAVGDGRVFRYQEPRIGMQQEGVVSGTVRFEGTRTGNTYSGTAFVFSRRCGAHPFRVSGTASEQEREIILYGTAPAGFDVACRPTVYSKHVVNFTFLRSVDPAPVVGGPIDRDQSAAEVDAKRASLEGAQAVKEDEEQRLSNLREQQERQAKDLREQRERAERIRDEREQEERRLAEVRGFSSQRDGCRKYNVEACDIALRSSHATQQDMIDLRNWRGVAEKLHADLDNCRTGSVAACNAALASPAIADGQRLLLNEWRIAASPFKRAMALLSKQAGMVATVMLDSARVIRNLPTSVHVTGCLAAVLALALAAMAFRIGHSPPSGEPHAPASSASEVVTSTLNHARFAVGWLQCLLGRFTQLLAAISDPAPPATHDTPGAIAALELAHAYIEEVREAETPRSVDHELRSHHLSTLALASKQLDAAQKLDPDAILDGQKKEEMPYRYSINELKAEAMLLEGITLHTYDIKSAIPALRKATTMNANNPYAFYVLGLAQAANKNKVEAVAALQRAVALCPKNLTYCKELNRAQSLYAGETAAYRATRISDGAIKTAIAGIMTVAATWKLVMFRLRVLR